MADTNVQLPPNSTGQQIRVETGDSENQIPTGVAEEVIILTDQGGLFAGDARQQASKMQLDSAMLEQIHGVLQRIESILMTGLDVDLNHDELLVVT